MQNSFKWEWLQSIIMANHLNLVEIFFLIEINYQKARIITAHPLIANNIATIIAFDAGWINLKKSTDTEIIIVAAITVAGAITSGILSANSNRCCISIFPLLFKHHHRGCD